MHNCTITKASEVAATIASVPKEKKKGITLNGNLAEKNYATFAVVIDNVLGKGEVHDKFRDIWVILSGSGRFNLGGKMVSPTSAGDGEWTSDSLEGADAVLVDAGDVIDIPPGEPHQTDGLGGRIEALVIKVPV